MGALRPSINTVLAPLHRQSKTIADEAAYFSFTKLNSTRPAISRNLQYVPYAVSATRPVILALIVVALSSSYLMFTHITHSLG